MLCTRLANSTDNADCNRRMPEGSRRDHRYQNKGARDERIVG